MRRLLAFLGTIGCSWTPALAGTPETLIERLTSDRHADRVSAGKELLQLGEAALPILDRTATSASEFDTRVRAQNLAETIRRTGENARLVTVAPVVLDYQGVPLATALADLKSKTGIPLVLHPTDVADPMRAVSLSTGPVSPWQAVDSFCRAAGLREVVTGTVDAKNLPGTPPLPNRRTSYAMAEIPQLSPGSVPVLLADGSYEPRAADFHSAVRVIALPPAYAGNRVIRGLGEVVLTLDVTPLPKLNWESIESVQIHRALDESSRPVPTAHLESGPSGFDPSIAQNVVIGGIAPFGGQQVWIEDQYGNPRTPDQVNPRLVAVRFRTGDRTVHRLKSLEGVVIGQVIQPNQTLMSVEDLASAVGTSFDGPGDTRLTVLSAETAGTGPATVRVRAEYPNPWTMQRLGFRGRFAVTGIMAPPLGGAVTLGGVGQMSFTDAVGKAIRSITVTNSQMSDDGFRQTYEVELSFPKSTGYGPPAKLVVIGNKPLRIEVPFRLENVRMP